MNQAAKEHGIKSFIPQILFSTSKDSPRLNWGGPSIHGEVVIKPLFGARGIGQIKLNADEYPVGNISMMFDNRSISWEDVENRLRADGLSITSREIFSPGEHISAIRNQGVAVTRYIPDIASEHRLLINPTGLVLVYDRTRDDIDGYWRVNNEAKSVLTDGKPRLLEEHPVLNGFNRDIRLMLKGLDMEYGSVDIFVKEGKWGMFEYSNEFGVVGNNIVEMRDFHEAAISVWVNRLVGVKS